MKSVHDVYPEIIQKMSGIYSECHKSALTTALLFRYARCVFCFSFIFPAIIPWNCIYSSNSCIIHTICLAAKFPGIFKVVWGGLRNLIHNIWIWSITQNRHVAPGCIFLLEVQNSVKLQHVMSCNFFVWQDNFTRPIPYSSWTAIISAITLFQLDSTIWTQ